jgi:uncharacterized membrane protein YeaQ/YmgE (transglycosylase-associated protein family)
MSLFGFIGALIIGLIVGVVAKFLMPGKDPGGCIITSLLGICGSIVATFLFGLVGNEPPDSGFLKFVASVVGAIIILAIYRAITGKKGG